MITILTMISLLASGGLYLGISWRLHRHATKLDDHLPLTSDTRQARVFSSQEFSAATVATTISLATLILAYAELAPSLGGWLLWTVLTTALGIFVVRIMAPIIWGRMAASGVHRATLHEFLGASFGSPLVRKSAALCTSLGFLGALAVELTVGSRFLAALAPAIPSWLTVTVIALIGVTYTALGGFRAVIVTDRIQMWAIWGAIAALGLVMAWQITENGGVSFLLREMPSDVYDFSWRAGLGAFLIGVFVINVPTFIADMSIWQRIAASSNAHVIRRGLLGSVVSAALSWTALAVIACLLIVLVSPPEGMNPLFAFLNNLGMSNNPLAIGLFMTIVAGLYAANLSTVSTQLIATAHTLHTDILRADKDRAALAEARREIAVSRAILVAGAIAAVMVVEVLAATGFSIADLVFAIYGAQLGLVPLVVVALFGKQAIVRQMGMWASTAVLAGFVSGWASAITGKMINDGDLVFLSPAVSLAISSMILFLGWLLARWSAVRA